jgi:antitoxin (DNA-binding transcriptional repressor) of toxin-antitoxin stability system
MSTISIAELKTHLSAELKKVQAGAVLTVTDHKLPVAEIHPVAKKKNTGFEISKPATESGPPPFPRTRLYKGTHEELMKSLEEDRADTWDNRDRW